MGRHNGRGGTELQCSGLLGELNPVFAIPSDSRIPMHLFSRRYGVILKRSGNWDEPEGCVSGHTAIFYTDGPKTEWGSTFPIKTGAFPLGQYTPVFQAILKPATWMIDERLKGKRIAICAICVEQSFDYFKNHWGM